MKRSAMMQRNTMKLALYMLWMPYVLAGHQYQVRGSVSSESSFGLLDDVNSLARTLSELRGFKKIPKDQLPEGYPYGPTKSSKSSKQSKASKKDKRSKGA